MTEHEELALKLTQVASALNDEGYAESARPVRRAAALLRRADRATSRLHRLQQENHRFREPERTILCDLLANGTLLPDPDGQRYGVPSPSPADGEVEKLAANLESVAIYLSDTGCDGYADYVNSAADYVEHAAALLRESRPQPVLVAQRPPGPEDCDTEGRVWVCERNRDMAPQWNLLRSRYASTNYGTTHWLPHWAIPTPTEPTTPTETPNG